MRLAVVDPQPVAGEVLAFSARRRGHQVVCLADESRLFGRLPFEPTAVIIAMNAGDDGCATTVVRLRDRFPRVLLIVTVERPSDSFATCALRAGADDVIRVPYHPSEVILKAEAAVARQDRAGGSSALEIGDLVVDLDKYVAAKAGRGLSLTKLELRLLYCLCEHSPHLTPLDRLLTFGWDSSSDPEPALIKTHMSHLRKKLHQAGGQPVEISSRQTLGYTIAFKEVESALSSEPREVERRELATAAH